MPKFQKKIYCTLDTETVGSLEKPKLFHIAGIIHTREGDTLGTFNYLAADRLPEAKESEFFRNKYYKYEEMISNGTGSLCANANIAVWNVSELLKHFNVNTLCAYNSHFDLARTEAKKLLNQSYDFIDIWLASLETIIDTVSFRNFCTENDLYSPSKKYLSTNAETVYKYLTKDISFEEEHTAFEDAIIEKQILQEVWKRHKKYTRNQHFNNIPGKFNLLPKA